MLRPTAAKLPGRSDPRKTRSHGEGALVRSGNLTHLIDRGKTRSTHATGKSSHAQSPPRPIPLAPDERSRRLAELRQALEGTAREFWSRTDEGEGGIEP